MTAQGSTDDLTDDSTHDSHRVHLLLRPHSDPAPPSLRLRAPASSARRTVWVVLVAVVAAGFVALLMLLWRSGSASEWGVAPPWHLVLNLAFTLLGGLLTLGVVAVVVSASRDSARRREALRFWEAERGRLRSARATVVAREAALTESGAVARIHLTVETGDGARINGIWQPASHGTSTVLQSQVPAIGSPALVWRVPGAGASAPIVIEVLDPSVVPSGQVSATREHVG